MHKNVCFRRTWVWVNSHGEHGATARGLRLLPPSLQPSPRESCCRSPSPRCLDHPFCWVLTRLLLRPGCCHRAPTGPWVCPLDFSPKLSTMLLSDCPPWLPCTGHPLALGPTPAASQPQSRTPQEGGSGRWNEEEGQTDSVIQPPSSVPWSLSLWRAPAFGEHLCVTMCACTCVCGGVGLGGASGPFPPSVYVSSL